MFQKARPFYQYKICPRDFKNGLDYGKITIENGWTLHLGSCFSTKAESMNLKGNLRVVISKMCTLEKR